MRDPYGRPPCAGSTREEIRAQAARGDLADALRRFDSSGADADLIQPGPRLPGRRNRDGRPRHAGEVARRLTAHLAGVQERLRAAELGRAAEEARAKEAEATAEAAQAKAAAERQRGG